MASQDPATGRPIKWRHTTWKLAPMVETNKSALDTAMYKEIDTLTTRQKVFLPLHIDGWTTGGPSIRGVEHRNEPEPNFENIDSSSFQDMAYIVSEPEAGGKRQSYHYMKEFISHMDHILEAMQAREALPNDGECCGCMSSAGRWRCKECTNPVLRLSLPTSSPCYKGEPRIGLTMSAELGQRGK